jgi:3-hydroxyacyl-CoA dehydrogenase
MQRLGKAVVLSHDTPNFIANRIGTFSMGNAIRLMMEQGLTIEEVDALTGAALGWPKTGRFGWATWWASMCWRMWRRTFRRRRRRIGDERPRMCAG